MFHREDKSPESGRTTSVSHTEKNMNVLSMTSAFIKDQTLEKFSRPSSPRITKESMLKNLKHALHGQIEIPHIYIFSEMEKLPEGFLSDRYVHKRVARNATKSGGISCYILMDIFVPTVIRCVESDYVSALTFDVKIRGKLFRISAVYIPPGPQILLNVSNLVIKNLVKFSEDYDSLFFGDFNVRASSFLFFYLSNNKIPFTARKRIRPDSLGWPIVLCYTK